jgi:hypothetical protein
MKRILTLTAAAAVIAAAGMTSVIAAPSAGDAPERVGNFQLTDTSRLAHELHYFKYAPAIVLMSQTNGGKVSREGAARLADLQATYKDRGVLFYMINSTLGQSREDTAKEALAQKFAFPVLMDELQLVGEELGIRREGEVFVIDPKAGFRVAYHGPVDQTSRAIDAVLAGQPVAKPRVAVSAGRDIAFPERGRAAEHASISYTNDIAPILQAKCVACHQEGGIAPFRFDSYDVVKSFAPMMLESVMSERMPPYFADPHIGNFQNDHGLSADQTRTLIHWLRAGAPRGTGPDVLKEKAGKAPEWPVSLGQPDVVVTLPAFDVPNAGTVEYQNMRVDNPFKEDTWLRAIAIKPGDRTVLHHVTSNHSPDPGTRARIPGGSVGSYTPGAEPQVIAAGAGAPVPAGGKLSFSMHYTTTGKAATDQTQIGYYTLKTAPEFIKRSAVISDFALRIPKGAARHTEIAYLEFPADAYLYTLYPHAHYRGWSVELTAKGPDGKEDILLSLPKYDFNWQRDYDPVEPLLIKAGTKLIAKWIYDNSEHNKANPDPSINVTWGEQSWEEMMYFRVNYRWAEETTSNVRNDLQGKLMESRTMGALDSNADGKVQVNELTGTMASVRTRFADLDLNKDGGLDAAEMASGNISRASATRDLRDADIDL